MSDEVDTRVSLDLDPGNIRSLPGYEQDDVRIYLNGTEGLFRDTHAALRAIHDAKAAAATDPTLTEAAKLLKVDDYASRRMTAVTKEWDRLNASLASNAEQFEKELDAPIVAKASQMVSGEIRSHFKSLKVSERVSAVQAAIQAGDEVTCSSVFGAPAYLSGLADELHRELTRQWQERSNPLASKRLRAVTAAREYLDRTGGLMLKEWHKAVGVIEVRQDVTDALGHTRSVVVKTLTAADVRRQKTEADRPFALPSN